ncbi:MAG: Wzz/FepE/Etk N-terminal domain-containing protein [Candidatus Paceibacterota bacterium]
MENINTNQNSDYDEIDLRELAGVLVKRKAIIIFSTVVATVLAFGISIAMPKIYRAQMDLEVGSVGAGSLVEGIAQAKDKIDRGLYVSDVTGKEIAAFSIKTANTPGSDIISLTAESSDREGVADILKEIGQAVIADQNKVVEARRQTIITQIGTIKTNIESVKTAGQYSGQECSRERYTAISDMENHVADLELAMTQIKDTAIISGPMVSDNPVKPNTKLNTAMGAILGLFCGIFAALVGNWWKEGGKGK